ncbi:E3 ubiquitin-protein ligase COP1 [Eumeta japonica]|uniref:E3 ubiquitin-protein ligase COP1 n=1 Tax=Eumeta variegata TaxID=151549 RepID=A0A4C1T7S1_EUMVA|nr:E3 ubiquitin-protein ligase COP1 [Eumeta japonica]
MSGAEAVGGGGGVGAGGGGARGGNAPRPAALAGLGGSVEDKNCDLLCPICFELIDEAYVTRCGHSFCYACIARSVDAHGRCPKCSVALPSRDHIYPNFVLNELAAKRRQAARGTPTAGGGGTPGVDAARPENERLATLVAAEARNLSLPDVQLLLDTLTRRKRLLEAESRLAQHRLLYDFLAHLHRARTAQAAQLQREAELVRKDMERVAAALPHPPPPPTVGNADAADGQPEPPLRRELAACAEAIPVDPDGSPTPDDEETFAGSGTGGGDALAQRWRRLHAHFDDFVQCYFAHRADELYFPPRSEGSGEPAPPGDNDATDSEAGRVPSATPPSLEEGSRAATGASGAEGEPRGLEAFREDLAAFTRYRALRPLATLSYSADAINYSTIVSTIEFDKDEELFAIAGVTKRIKVFDYAAVVGDAVDVHYPCAEMACAHKVSCVSWNAYHKGVLASADYEGAVCVWDAGTAQRTRAYHEHDKRAWSVHFNRADVRLLASGSDDARVKLWALNADRSVATLEARFNVCCVRFNPRSSCHLAFGSADHCVHYYDLRAPRRPLAVLRDHRKAVSYVKFLDAHRLVSASTDSQLKLWRVESARCLRSFTGHANEKNFVGLATDGKYIACGSENNALYLYYSGLSRPLLTYRFDAVRGLFDRPAPPAPAPVAGAATAPGTERREDEPSEFVSAVCWRRGGGASVLLAANSQGTIKVLELV